jgi:hypothetical protein
MKKVIFIGGTSYSGSTILDMIIANDVNGFSTGEVHALFWPYRRKHLRPLCGCGKKDCTLWDSIKLEGEKKVYKTIFKQNQNLNFIVDSSKDPNWIYQQSKNLLRQNIEVKNLLIWKTPSEFSVSYKKRNKKKWEKEWQNYHKEYFTLVKSFKTVKYKDLVHDRETLIKICDYLGISYFDTKIKFWNKQHHTLFGNSSAKIHLYSKNTENYKVKKDEINRMADIRDFCNNKYQKIYYEKVNTLKHVDISNKYSRIPTIVDILENQKAGTQIYFEIGDHLKAKNSRIRLKRIRRQLTALSLLKGGRLISTFRNNRN